MATRIPIATGLDNLQATVNPAVTDDSAHGYTVGSRWFNTTDEILFVCFDPEVGAAIWQEIKTHTALVDPAATNDHAHGHFKGQLWFRTDTHELFLCVNDTDGAAAWAEISASGGGSVYLRAVDPTVDDDLAHGYDPGELWENTVDQRLFICLDATTGNAVWVPVAALPTKKDLAKAPLATVGNEQDTGIRITYTPAGVGSGFTGDRAVTVDVNGVIAEVGDGVKTKDCFFSASAAAPYTARFLADVQAGDKLIWNGVIAGYNLEVSFIVRVFYVALWLLVVGGPAMWGVMVWGAFTWGA